MSWLFWLALGVNLGAWLTIVVLAGCVLWALNREGF